MKSSIDFIVLPEADKDIADILQYTLETWGEDQEAAYWTVPWEPFKRIRLFPDLGRVRSSDSPTIHELHLAHHTIVYRRELNRIVILRIVNARRRR